MAKEIQLITKRTSPDYKRIYHEIIEKDCPEKNKDINAIFDKKIIKSYDIIELDMLINGTGSKKEQTFNQQHRAYDEDTIKYILDYQSKYALTNIKTSEIFRVSRNTISKWKKLFG